MVMCRTSGRMKAFVVCLVLLVNSVYITAAPHAEQQAAEGAYEVTDMRGRTVAVPRTIDSIIALGANSLRLLSYFDSIDKVIAVEDTGHAREKTEHQFFHLATYRIAFPQLRELPSIGNSSSHEAIIAAAPDIIFSSSVDVGQLDQLQQILDIPVFAINADVELSDQELFFEQFRVIGRVLGEESRAEELVSGITDIIDDIALRVSSLDQGKRAYAGGMMYYGPADLLRTTGDYDPFDFTNTVNVMPTNPSNNRQPYMTSVEYVIAANPAYVFVDAANDTLAREGYVAHAAVLDEHVDAFRNRNVYTTLVYKYYGTNWENQIINIYYVGKVLYPELFSDVVIEGKAEEILQLFFGVPVDYHEVAKLQAPAFGPAQWF